MYMFHQKKMDGMKTITVLYSSGKEMATTSIAQEDYLAPVRT